MPTLIRFFTTPRETYRVHGPAHPATLKARRLALQMERLRLQELAVEAKAAKLAAKQPKPDMLTVPDLSREIKREGKWLVVGNQNFSTLADALKAARA